MGPLQSKCRKCVDKRAKAKETAKKERLKIKRQKHKERPAALKKKLDIIFSKYIRLRDKGKPCITCGKPWEPTAQCGHVFSRKHLATRWEEMNANGQCPGCNMFEGGRQYEHALETDRKWGVGIASTLHTMSKSVFRPSPEWYKERIAHYEAKTQALEEMQSVR